MTEIDSLFDKLLEQQRNKKLPPVETWKPKNLGAIDIKISRDGTWVHEGGIATPLIAPARLAA